MGLIHRGILGLVWLAFATSSIVFTEPAPVDALLIGLIALLPAAGLVTVTPTLCVYLALWGIAAASGFLASTLSRDLAGSTIFTAVSLYLYVASFVLAAFVASNPQRHAALILNGWMFAALIASAAAFVGYFQIIPGAFEIFKKYARASGTFKDPNVFGPFVVPPFLYALHIALNRPWHGAIAPLAVAGVLAFANLLSFSRGAWINLIFALGIYGVLAYAMARTNQQREKIISLVVAGCLLLVAVTAAVLQDDKMGSFIQDRASLTQSYDVGPTGRFGGQEKAIRLLLDNPFGIGAGDFARVYYHEEVHNVFLSMFLNAGWLGGFTYALMVGVTLTVGARHLKVDTTGRPLFLIAYAAFVATALEGIIIDTDHWRSFYFLMAIVWGMACAPLPALQKSRYLTG